MSSAFGGSTEEHLFKAESTHTHNTPHGTPGTVLTAVAGCKHEELVGTSRSLAKIREKTTSPGCQIQSELCAPTPWNKLIPVAVPANKKPNEKKAMTNHSILSPGGQLSYIYLWISEAPNSRPAHWNFRSSRPIRPGLAPCNQNLTLTLTLTLYYGLWVWKGIWI